MEISPFMVYLIGNADQLLCTIRFFAVIFCMVSFILMIVWFGFSDDKNRPELKERIGKVLKILVSVSALLIPLSTMMPSTKTAAAMYILPAIVRNENVQKIGSGLYDLAVMWMEELKPKSSTNK